jgi:hypothetical protein
MHIKVRRPMAILTTTLATLALAAAPAVAGEDDDGDEDEAAPAQPAPAPAGGEISGSLGDVPQCGGRHRCRRYRSAGSRLPAPGVGLWRAIVLMATGGGLVAVARRGE